MQSSEREQIANDVSKELAGHGIDMLIVDDTAEAADHAVRTGLIYREALPAIEQDRLEDKGVVGGKEGQ